MEPTQKEEECDLEKGLAPTIYENSHVLNKLLQDVTDQKHQLIKENEELKRQVYEEGFSMSESEDTNGWTPENCATVEKWQRSVEHTSFIYGEILLNVKKRLVTILITSLALTVLSAIFGSLSIALAFLNQKWISVSFQILITISNALSGFLLALIPIFSLEQKLQDFTQFTGKLDSLWFLFQIEQDISPKERISAADFIKRMDGQYLSLMQQCPFIDVEQYQKADRSYKNRLFQNSNWAKKLIQNKVE
jgi:hypothetical protein